VAAKKTLLPVFGELNLPGGRADPGVILCGVAMRPLLLKVCTRSPSLGWSSAACYGLPHSARRPKGRARNLGEAGSAQPRRGEHYTVGAAPACASPASNAKPLKA